jgi:hypothetical protein
MRLVKALPELAEVVAKSDNLWVGRLQPLPKVPRVLLPAQHPDHVDHAGLARGSDADVAVSAAVLERVAQEA